MTRRRTYLGAHRIRRTYLGFDSSAWAIAIPAGLAIALLGFALVSGALLFGGGPAQ